MSPADQRALLFLILVATLGAAWVHWRLMTAAPATPPRRTPAPVAAAPDLDGCSMLSRYVTAARRAQAAGRARQDADAAGLDAVRSAEPRATVLAASTRRRALDAIYASGDPAVLARFVAGVCRTRQTSGAWGRRT